MSTPHSNPFDLTKASDYSDQQVVDFWVDLAGSSGGLIGFLKPTSLMPMFLLGGKGSGKTHLMRYCSAPVQALRHGNDLIAAVAAEGYVGIYTRADGLNVNRFSGKGQTSEVWADVFSFSFELWLAGCLLDSIRPLLDKKLRRSKTWNQNVVLDVGRLMHAPLPPEVVTLEQLEVHFEALRRNVDYAVNNCAISRKLEGVEIVFNPGSLVFGITEVIAKHCRLLKDTVFVYLIDEVENFTGEQQRFLNSLVRYRRGNTSVKVGARLYGIKTKETLGAGEPIKRDAEFEQVKLDAMFREHSDQYEDLAMLLVAKRLEATNIAAVKPGNLSKHFLVPDSSQFYREESIAVVKVRDRTGKLRPHAERLRNALGDILTKAEADNVVNSLLVESNPLIEKLNFLSFYKRIGKSTNISELAETIKQDAQAVIAGGPQAAREYYELYSHFSSDLLAQLFRDYGRKPIYAGFPTLIRLSQGVPRNLLSLLKHIYRRATFSGEQPFTGAPVSIDSQILGVHDAAEWFWEDAQPDAYGNLVRTAVEHLATLARAVRYSDSPSECDLCCFRINEAKLSSEARRALDMAENWSFVIRTSASSSSKNDERVATKYQINPMLAARWGISESRRGSLDMVDSFAEIMLTTADAQLANAAIAERVSNMNLPRLLDALKTSADSKNQQGLF